MQNRLPKVQWGDIQIDNCWHFKYLGAQFEAGGGQLYDVRKRVAMAKQRHDKMRHISHRRLIWALHQMKFT